MKNYQQFIIDELNLRVPEGKVDPRHIEGFIRLAHSDPALLSEDDLREEIVIGIMCLAQEGKEKAEFVAKQFGL